MIRLTWDLPAEAKYVRLCRHLARTTLESMEVDPRQVEEMELAIGELCTNVVRHSKLSPSSSYLVEFEVNDDVASFTVSDNGVGFVPLVTEEPTPTDSGGLGLWLVNQFTDRLEFRKLDGQGTSVRAEKNLRIASPV